MTMTPEQIKNHIGEVWEDDRGRLTLPLYAGEKRVFFRALSGDSAGGEGTASFNEFLAHNNLPQSLRKAKPRMVKAPGWKVWYCDNLFFPLCEIVLLRKETAIQEARRLTTNHLNVAIQAPGSDEMEVVKGFE